MSKRPDWLEIRPKYKGELFELMICDACNKPLTEHELMLYGSFCILKRKKP